MAGGVQVSGSGVAALCRLLSFKGRFSLIGAASMSTRRDPPVVLGIFPSMCPKFSFSAIAFEA